MDREVLDRWCERGILALVLAILVFAPLATGAVRTLEFLVVQTLTTAVMALWILRLWISPRPQLLWPPICWAVLAFLGYAVGRYFTADIEYVARLELIQVVVYSLLFLAIVNNLHRQEYSQVIAFTLVFLGLAESFYALAQFLTKSNRVWYFITPYQHRGTGTFINPNNLGGMLEMLIPLGLAYTLVGRLKPVTRVLLGYSSLMMLGGLAVTLSRGAWVATALALAGLVAFMLPRRSLRVQALALLALLLGAGLYFVPENYSFRQRLAQTTEAKGDTYSRYQIWDAALQMWRDHPWWGVGPAHFDQRFHEYRPDQIQARPDRTHNDYLNTLVDWGGVGAAIAAAGGLLLWLGVWRTWRHVSRAERDFGNKLTNKFAFVLGATLSLVALTAHSAVDFNLHIPANALLAAALAALLTSYQRFATEAYWSTARLGQRGALSVLLLGGVAVLGAQGWRRAQEYAWLQRVPEAPLSAPARITALEGAFTVEPKNAETAYALGETYRAQCWDAFDSGYDKAGEAAGRHALEWFARARNLNPYDSRPWLSAGMCLDKLGRFDESEPFYQRADTLDPSSYFTAANIGWHYVQTGDYAAARPWFERSQRLLTFDNPIAVNYLKIVTARLLEAAAPPPPRAR